MATGAERQAAWREGRAAEVEGLKGSLQRALERENGLRASINKLRFELAAKTRAAPQQVDPVVSPEPAVVDLAAQPSPPTSCSPPSIVSAQPATSTLADTVDKWLTRQDYRLGASCLQPDGAPEGARERFEQAHAVFNKLLGYVDPDPLARRGRGW